MAGILDDFDVGVAVGTSFFDDLAVGRVDPRVRAVDESHRNFVTNLRFYFLADGKLRPGSVLEQSVEGQLPTYVDIVAVVNVLADGSLAIVWEHALVLANNVRSGTPQESWR